MQNDDLIGKKFNRLKVVDRADDYIYISKNGKIKRRKKYKCICDCGNIVESVSKHDLTSGHTKSCGCLNREMTAKRNIDNRLLNKYVEYDNYYLGYIDDDITFKIDKDDYEKCKNFTWRINKQGYIETRYYSKRIFLHRYVMNVHNEKWINNNIDHINHDKLDNRKLNLRIVTSSQNTMNSTVRKDNSLGLKGITLRKDCNRYEVHICKNGISYYLGLYETLEKAIKIRKDAEIKYHGEYAYK